VRWDAHAARLFRGVAWGPARVTFARPVRLSHRGDRLVARDDDSAAAGQAVVLCDGQKLELRP
jgi:hypothetical protein